MRAGAQPCRWVAWVVARDQRAELPGTYPAREAEGLRAGARPFAGGLAAAGVVVVLPLGYLLLVVAVLAERDLPNREHSGAKIAKEATFWCNCVPWWLSRKGLRSRWG